MPTSLFGSCAKTADNTASLSERTVSDLALIYETEFGGINIDAAIDNFNSFGFTYGDSIDVLFFNGYQLTDIPYYIGYYTQTGEPLLIAYPGYPYVKVCIK